MVHPSWKKIKTEPTNPNPLRIKCVICKKEFEQKRFERQCGPHPKRHKKTTREYSKRYYEKLRANEEDYFFRVLQIRLTDPRNAVNHWLI